MRFIYAARPVNLLRTAALLLCGCAGSPVPPVQQDGPLETTASAAPVPAQCCECEGPALARRAKAIEDHPELLVTPWLEPGERPRLSALDVRLADQDGRSLTLGELAGKPTALSFLYTRCTNPNKCPLVAATMAALQDDLRSAGLANEARLCLLTYDPEFDTPPALKAYGARFNFRFGGDVLFLRPDPADKERLFNELKLAVNFGPLGVNVHGIQLVLLDRKTRYVRRYQTLIWSNADVVADLRRLVAEAR